MTTGPTSNHLCWLHLPANWQTFTVNWSVQLKLITDCMSLNSPEQHVPPSEPCRSGQARGNRPKKVLTHRVDLPQVQVVGSTSRRSPQAPQAVGISKSLNTRRQNATWISNELDHLMANDTFSYLADAHIQSDRVGAVTVIYSADSFCSAGLAVHHIRVYYSSHACPCVWSVSEWLCSL